MPLTDSERQRRRREKIKTAGLVSRKVIGHPDDFDAIHRYAENKFKKRGIVLDREPSRS